MDVSIVLVYPSCAVASPALMMLMTLRSHAVRRPCVTLRLCAALLREMLLALRTTQDTGTLLYTSLLFSSHVLSPPSLLLLTTRLISFHFASAPDISYSFFPIDSLPLFHLFLCFKLYFRNNGRLDSATTRDNPQQARLPL